MKHRSGLITGLASVFLLAGIASAAETAAADAGAKPEAPQKKAPAESPRCTTAPGSHIRLSKPEDCARAARGPYRSYSKDEIDRTGETNLAEALRKLDPSFR